MCWLCALRHFSWAGQGERVRPAPATPLRPLPGSWGPLQARGRPAFCPILPLHVVVFCPLETPGRLAPASSGLSGCLHFPVGSGDLPSAPLFPSPPPPPSFPLSLSLYPLSPLHLSLPLSLPLPPSPPLPFSPFLPSLSLPSHSISIPLSRSLLSPLSSTVPRSPLLSSPPPTLFVSPSPGVRGSWD